METLIKHIRTPWYIKIIRIILPIIIIGTGIGFAKYLYDTKPVAKRIKPVVLPPLVDIIAVNPVDHEVIISSMGKVSSSQTISLRPRVSGFVIQTSTEFIKGGLYRKGDLILKLDPRDFELAIQQQEAMLQKAQASLKIEMGKQEVAKSEFKLMQNTSTRPMGESNLALRVPQLEQIKAETASIKVDLERARLNLERTSVTAPFNCMVMETKVEQGSQISSQESSATLSGTDEYFVEAAVPVEHLKWIYFPDNSNYSRSSSEKPAASRGSNVIIATIDEAAYQGQVIRLIGNLSDKSGLAQIIISIKDPLLLKKDKYNESNSNKISLKHNKDLSNKDRVPLLIDSYVNVEIQGRVIENVFSIPRAAVRDGNKIWIAADSENKTTLNIKNINVLWKDKEAVYIKDNINKGDMLVISELSSPVDGMVIKLPVVF